MQKNTSILWLISKKYCTFATRMCSLDSFDIDLKGLKDNEATFSFSLNDEYFAAVEATEVAKGNAEVKAVVRKTADSFFELDFHIAGEVIVLCDRCLEEMPLAIETDGKLVAKFGEDDSDDGDLVVVNENDGVLNTAWFIYEFIALALPIKHVHAPGKCNRAMIEKINSHAAARSSDGADEDNIDPRWSALKNLKIENN